MKIEVNIPALDRLCAILEKGVQLPKASASIPAPAPVVEETKEAPAKKAAKKAPAKKAAKVAEEPKVTQEEVTKVAKELVALRSPGELRTVLNTVIAAEEKISTCEESNYAEIKAALEKRVAEIKEEDEAGL